MDKKINLVVKETSFAPVEGRDGVIVISGYANRYLDDNGRLVVDRSSESVLPDGYDINSFLKNPILLHQHNQNAPIGKVINIDIRQDGLYIEAEVHRAMDAKVYYGVENGIIKTFSIGFTAKDAKEVDDIWFWTKVELLEVSLVSVPDNQESTFSVLTDSPCSNGMCLLASRATPINKAAINTKSKVSKKAWHEVDKAELKDNIEKSSDEGIVKEAFLVVRDATKKSTWKFPHHDFDDTTKELSISKGGIMSAFSALKGAKDNDVLSDGEKYEAIEHLIKHFEELKASGEIDDIPEDALALRDELKTKYMGGIDTMADEVLDNEVEKCASQTGVNETIDTVETGKEVTKDAEDNGTQEANSEGNPEENAESSNQEAASEEKPEVSVDAIKDFISEAKDTPDGLNSLLELYMTLEETINGELSKLN